DLGAALRRAGTGGAQVGRPLLGQLEARRESSGPGGDPRTHIPGAGHGGLGRAAAEPRHPRDAGERSRRGALAAAAAGARAHHEGTRRFPAGAGPEPPGGAAPGRAHGRSSEGAGLRRGEDRPIASSQSGLAPLLLRKIVDSPWARTHNFRNSPHSRVQASLVGEERETGRERPAVRPHTFITWGVLLFPRGAPGCSGRQDWGLSGDELDMGNEKRLLWAGFMAILAAG